MLSGVVVWSIFGTIETTVETCITVEDGKAICYVCSEDVSRLEEGMTVSSESAVGIVKSIASVPVQIDESFNDYVLYLTGLKKGDFCYAVEVEIPDITEGVYAAVITVDSINPIVFVIR